MARIAYFLLTVLMSSYVCEAYKILVVFPFPGKSHSILGEGVVRHLLNAGHEVTIITPFLQKNPPPNLHQIDVTENLKIFPSDAINLKAILEKEVNPNNMRSFIHLLLNLSNETFANPNVQKLLHDQSQKFDLIIIEWLFSEMVSALSVVYDCPYIWFSTVEPHWLILSLIDEILNPAYNPDTMSTVTAPFSFIQRVKELGSMAMTAILRTFYLLPKETLLYEQVFGPIVAKKGRTLPPYDEVRYNASLMFGNSHVSLGQATRLPQNYKPVAGYHIDPKVKPLPDDLKKIMESAKNGVIYFSLGSNLKSKDMPEKLKRDLLDMFGSLEYTVIWKFEEALSDVPKNVHIVHWAPQPSILAHPNCILFITHGGLLSTTETIHYGVPIIGIPVFADQHVNIHRAVKKGIAERVEFSYSMPDDLKIAITKLTSNPRYREKVKELSLIYHDRPVSPGAELVHWAEHVIRTRGAAHLRSPALHVPFYQKLYLDLIALIVVVLVGVKIILKRLFCSKKRQDNTKKTN